MNDLFAMPQQSEERFFFSTGLFFLNWSLAKESVVISDAETCERDRETLTEFKVESKQLKEKLLLLEGQRADLQTQVENVHSLPGLAKDRARIEDAEKRLRRLEEIYEEKMEHASQKHRDQIAKVNKELERQVGLFEQECKHVYVCVYACMYVFYNSQSSIYSYVNK